MSGSVVFVIITSIIAFMVIVLILVSTLLYARAKLTAVGLVKININGEKEVTVNPGSSLLSTLSESGIYLPSACGGGGTCAQCRCQVVEGGGSILATETGYFTRREQQENWRLGCQVKIREDMKIKVPEEVLGVKKWECEVVSNDNVATYIKEFIVKLPEGEKLDFKSGGYIQIDVPKIDVDFKEMSIGGEYQPEWERYGMFSLQMKSPEPTYRAYSMANHPAEGNIVILNIRIATPPFDRASCSYSKVNPGICSSYIFTRKPGDKVIVSGPYGEFFLKENNNEMMFIGGGAGMAPMRSHLFHLFHTMKETKRKVTFWYGARSWREVFYYDEFMSIQKEFPNFSFNLALSEPQPEDNWTGHKGFIHQVIYDQYLSKHEEPEEIDYYLCGPPLMNDAVNKMLYDMGVPDENVLFDDFGG
jgi:Na+-transporting NADH:ubiquinone oxidoreductase subunit F